MRKVPCPADVPESDLIAMIDAQMAQGRHAITYIKIAPQKLCAVQVMSTSDRSIAEYELPEPVARHARQYLGRRDSSG